MKQYRIIWSILMVSILCSICLLAGCSGQTAPDNEKFAELIALTKGQAPIFDEVAGGIDENDTRFVSEPFWDGGEMHHYKDPAKSNLDILVGHRAGGEEHLLYVIAEEGEFFGVTLGKDTIDAVMEALGEPEAYQEKDDMYELPMAIYEFREPTGKLWIHANEDRTVRNMQYDAAKFPNLEALAKGEIPLMQEFEGGLEANVDKVINTGEYYNGGIIYRLKDETRQNLRLFFVPRDGVEQLSVISAEEGGIFDILIGHDTFADIEVVLGEPSYATEKDDMYELPRMSYYYPHGQLLLRGDENHTVTEVTFIADTK